jgi:hypothetical protein
MARFVTNLVTVLIVATIPAINAAVESEAATLHHQTHPNGHFHAIYDEAAASAFKSIEVTHATRSSMLSN